MKIRSLCFCVLVLSAPLAGASIQLDAISCSSSLSLNDQNSVSLDCGGDFALSGGRISAETGDILINAAGALSLDKILFTAASITLTGNAVYIADDVTFDISVVDTSVTDQPSLNISSGRNIDLTLEPTLEILPKPGVEIITGGIDWQTFNVNAYQSVIFTQRQSGGEISIFTPRGEIELLDIGIVGSNAPTGILKPFQGILSTVPIPIPAAFSQLLLGLCVLITPALQRKKVR